MRTVIPGFFFVALLIGAIALAGVGAQQWLTAQTSKSWQTTTGTITYAAFEYAGSGSDRTRRPVVRYSYTVNGSDYDSNRIAFGPTPNDKGSEPVFTTSRSDQIKVFATRAAGSDVAVYYSPDAPENAVLLPGGGMFLLIYLLCAAMMLGVSGMCFMLMTGRIKT